MKHLRVYLLLSLAIVLLGIGFVAPQPSPVEAAGRVVYVDVRMTATQKDHWGISSAKGFVDKYTGSRLSFHACRSGYKCIIIQRKTVNSAWAAVTTGYSATYSASTRAYISLNPQREYYSWNTKRSIVIHELGHANGITWHSATCTNVMYKNVFCSNGSLPPLRFSQDQLNRLRAN